ncbi:hypothetical protein [Nostoc sp.]|uniref:hypothetical protein n=1 Tax=Nostoc sp. TaxID=1180 RepID=UPI002FF969EF
MISNNTFNFLEVAFSKLPEKPNGYQLEFQDYQDNSTTYRNTWTIAIARAGNHLG